MYPCTGIYIFNKANALTGSRLRLRLRKHEIFTILSDT